MKKWIHLALPSKIATHDYDRLNCTHISHLFTVRRNKKIKINIKFSESVDKYKIAFVMLCINNTLSNYLSCYFNKHHWIEKYVYE